MYISIIGAGNGGQTMAGHFALLGHKVTLYNIDRNAVSIIFNTKKIVLNEAITGTAYLYNITDNLNEAVNEAELIMLTTTADAHRELAKKMAPLLHPGQILVLNPGRTLGALDFANTFRALTDTRIYIAEAQTLIYACRAESPGNVRVIGVKEKVLLAAYPSKDTDYVLDKVNSVYNCFIKAENILRTSLENIGAVFHPVIVLFNAAAIERGNQFFFYNDMTPAIASFIESVDKERLAVGHAFGLDLLSVNDWVSYAYHGIEGKTLCEKLKSNPAYYKILAPAILHSRLLLEDIPTGLIPLVELAKLAHVKTPLMSSLINIAQSLLIIDFYTNGRTLQNLGLSHTDVDTFKRTIL